MCKFKRKLIERFTSSKKNFVYMYKMGSEAKVLTQIRKITAEKYSENKIHILWLYKKFTDCFYIIWVSMIDWQKLLDLQNVSYSAIKKIQSYCNTKHPTKHQVKKCKRKMSQWINGDERVYIREDLAYNLICYSNLGVIKAHKFRKNLGISNHRSIWRERK